MTEQKKQNAFRAIGATAEKVLVFVMMAGTALLSVIAFGECFISKI